MSEINEKLELIKAIQNSSTETAMQINALAAKGFYVEGMANALMSVVSASLLILCVFILLVGIHKENEWMIVGGLLIGVFTFLILIVSASIAIPYILAPEAQLVLEIAR